MNSENILINLEVHLNEMRKRYSKNKNDYEEKMSKSRTQKEIKHNYNWYRYYEGKVDIIESLLGNIKRNSYNKTTKDYKELIQEVYN